MEHDDRSFGVISAQRQAPTWRSWSAPARRNWKPCGEGLATAVDGNYVRHHRRLDAADHVTGLNPYIRTFFNCGDNLIRLRDLITTIALLSLLSSPVALAHTTGSAGSSARTASLAANTRLIGRAPVGHRQPHADDVPAENDIDHISAEDAAVDSKINNICRGC